MCQPNVSRNGLGDGLSLDRTRQKDNTGVYLLMKDQQKYCYVTTILHRECTVDVHSRWELLVIIILRENVCSVCERVFVIFSFSELWGEGEDEWFCHVNLSKLCKNDSREFILALFALAKFGKIAAQAAPGLHTCALRRPASTHHITLSAT